MKPAFTMNYCLCLEGKKSPSKIFKIKQEEKCCAIFSLVTHLDGIGIHTIFGVCVCKKPQWGHFEMGGCPFKKEEKNREYKLSFIQDKIIICFPVGWKSQALCTAPVDWCHFWPRRVTPKTVKMLPCLAVSIHGWPWWGLECGH